MTIENDNSAQLPLAPVELPAVKVRRQRWPSPVWLIPLLAALIGLWMLYNYWSQRGNIITVHFSSADSIEPGKTQVRYKAVTVGKVKSVTLDEHLNPLVELALSKDISAALKCSAQFWVVRPRIKGTEISGLNTLFSGTYVGMRPYRDDMEAFDVTADPTTCYQALEAPPPMRPSRPGREFKLLAESMGSIDMGTPVFYKQLQVGEVINYRLAGQGEKVEVGIFIDEPYYRFINAGTLFWNASGLDFRVGATGAELRMESLASLLVGGIAFDTPTDQVDKTVSEPGALFDLYPNYASSRAKRYQERVYYTLYFAGSLRGLAEKAPVEYKGIRVGQVEKISMYLDQETQELRLPVLISIEPKRFSESLALAEAPTLFEKFVERGLRAQLQTSSLITGQQVVNLVFEQQAEPQTIEHGQFYDTFPTSRQASKTLSELANDVAADLQKTSSQLRRLMASQAVDDVLKNTNALLVETKAAMQDARVAMADARQVLQSLDQQTLPAFSDNILAARASFTASLAALNKNVEQVSRRADVSLLALTDAWSQTGSDFSLTSTQLNQTMQRLQNTLTHLDRLLAKNSPTQYQISEMLDEMTAMSRSVRELADTLQSQPESLIRGRQGD